MTFGIYAQISKYKYKVKLAKNLFQKWILQQVTCTNTTQILVHHICIQKHPDTQTHTCIRTYLVGSNLSMKSCNIEQNTSLFVNQRRTNESTAAYATYNHMDAQNTITPYLEQVFISPFLCTFSVTGSWSGYSKNCLQVQVFGLQFFGPGLFMSYQSTAVQVLINKRASSNLCSLTYCNYI